jgi:NAD(P)-dependent dehydrogenase (short-subunit alcohol dehydrogenase family)
VRARLPTGSCSQALFYSRAEEMRTIVVTGVSSGIGRGIVKVLISCGLHVFGSVRKSSDGEKLRQELGDRFTPLLFDITDRNALLDGAGVVRSALGGSTLDGLVNNAGIAVAGPLLTISAQDFRRQLEANLLGSLGVIQAFAPMLGVDEALIGRPGRIVNITSLGGRIGLPFLGPYVASKHALEGLSESLRRELIPYGIDVVMVAPGGVATSIWDKAEELDLANLGTAYREPARRFRESMVKIGRSGLTADRIGQVVLTALTTPHPRVRYAPVANPIRNWILPRILPRRLVDKIITARLGMTRRGP